MSQTYFFVSNPASFYYSLLRIPSLLDLISTILIAFVLLLTLQGSCSQQHVFKTFLGGKVSTSLACVVTCKKVACYNTSQHLVGKTNFAQPYFYLLSNSYYLHKIQSKTRLQGRSKRVTSFSPTKNQKTMLNGHCEMMPAGDILVILQGLPLYSF